MRISKFVLLLLFLIVITGIGLFWSHSAFNEQAFYPEPITLETETERFVATETMLMQETIVQETQPVQIETEIHMPVKFFYEQLIDEEDRIIYHLLRDGVALGEIEIRIYSDDTQRIFEIYQLIHFDYPEFFWMTGWGKMTTYRWSDGRVYTIFKPEYGHVGAEKERMRAEIDAVVDAFLLTVDEDATEFERVLAVYEYIILTTKYNLDAPDNQNIYSVFVNRESVCAGFSRAAQLLLERLGVFVTYVIGEAYVPGFMDYPVAHAWNLVRVDGEYYYLDVTWGSPMFAEDSILSDRIHIIYDYLLVNEEKLFRTHVLAEGITMPSVVSTRSNFFSVQGMFYYEYDPIAVLESMNASVINADEWIAFQFATPELFQLMRVSIIEEFAPIAARNLLEFHQLSSVQFVFREKENLNKITIYWLYE